MGPKSSVSTLAMNGSASESIYESDSTVGTLQNDEEWDEVPNQEERSPEQVRSLQEYLSSPESQTRPASENYEEYPWADKDRGGPSAPSPQIPLDRYLDDPDDRQQFFVAGKGIEQIDIAERYKRISSAEKRRTDGNEVCRNTAKKVKQPKMEGSKGVDGEKRNNSKTIDEKGSSKNGRRKRRRAGETLRLVEDN